MGIYKRKEGKTGGKWWGNINGDRFPLDVPLGPDTRGMKALANERFAQIILEKKNGTYFQTRQEHKRTLAELIESYMDAEGKNLKAANNYYKIGRDGEVKGYAVRLFEKLGKDSKLNTIDSGKVIDYKTTRQKDGLTPCGINQELAFLRQAWNYGIRRKWCKRDSNPVSEAGMVKGASKQKRKRYLQEGELEKLVKALGPKWPRYTALLLTGLRRSELVKLEWRDIDLKNKTLTVPESKSGDPRTIPLDDAAIPFFQTIPQGEPKTTLVFFNRRYKALDPRKLTRDMTTAVRQAGLPDLRLHDLRRTYGTWKLQSGVRLDVVSKLLGHASTKTTEIYAYHVVDSLRADLDQARPIPALVTGLSQGTVGNA